VATVSGSTVTIKKAGTSLITANQAGNASYEAAPAATATLTVNKANQTITGLSDMNKTVGDAAFDLSATAPGGTVTYTSSNTAVATISGITVTIVGEGTSTITAKQAGNTNYNAAPDKTATLTTVSGKANQTITGLSDITKTYGDAAFALSATASSGLAVTYTSSNTAVATISGSTVTIKGGGTSTITANQAGNTNYNAAPAVTAVLTVNKKAQTITASTTAINKVNDASTFNWTGTASSGLTVAYTSSNTAVATISIAGVVTLKGAGTTYLRANQAGDTNYSAAAQVQATLTVTASGAVGTTYCYPNNLGCWTSNSTAGTPSKTQYGGKTAGARGYYYTWANAAGACTGDYTLPTEAQWIALQTYLNGTSAKAAEKNFFFTGDALAGYYFVNDDLWGAWDMHGYWWTSTYYLFISTALGGSMNDPYTTTINYLPVRCVKTN
jgi:hypothetical protein